MIRAVGLPTVLLAGGGTGGHLFPGVAVAEAVLRTAPGSRALLAVTDRDRGSQHAAACCLEMVEVDSPRLPGRAVGYPGFGASLARAVARSLLLLRDERVSVVVGLGGYGSVAPVLAARLAGLPSVLLEQNAIPGKATRMLSRVASATAASLPGIEQRGVRGRVEWTGNPLRASVLRTRAAHAELGLVPGVPVLGVLGGSLGARGMNARLLAALPALVKTAGAPQVPVLDAGMPRFAAGLQVIHATGGSDDDARAAAAAYAALGLRACVRPFFADMAAVYGTADVLLCRAGGTTVAEITAVGRAAVFVPYPHHADGHQRENARALVESGAAALLEEATMTPAAVVAALVPLLRDRALRRRRARAARRLGRPDAAERVAQLLLALARGETSLPPGKLIPIRAEETPA